METQGHRIHEENKMKDGALRKLGRWSASGVLLAGILYSILTLIAKPVYAASCDCNEAAADAGEFCLANFGHANYYDFQCPVGPAGGPFIALWKCSYEPGDITRGAACPD